MSKSFRRGSVAALAVAGLTLSLAPSASATPDDYDYLWNVDVDNATEIRIAGNTRVTTAIKASQSRDDWGRCFNFNQYDYRSSEGRHDRRRTNCNIDIILARSDNYSDALAASPLADVLDAPILITDGNALDPDVADEIERLSAKHEKGWWGRTTVHILGGTAALSHDVRDEVEDLDGVDTTWRYQGIDRFETAVNIAEVTVEAYGIESGAAIDEINVFLTTGSNFPDALAAGAAAANDDGVVLLTDGEGWDRRGFTEEAIINLEDWIPGWDQNTNETFAIGGPAVRAALAGDVRLGNDGAISGSDRYETAVLAAERFFETSFASKDFFAVASGVNFPDAVVASAFIANADGPLLLTRPAALSNVTEQYLMENADNNDVVFTFGGTGSVSQQVSLDIRAALAF